MESNLTPEGVEAYQDFETRDPEEWKKREAEVDAWGDLLGDPTTLGGKGSGNFGHVGRPGEVGGSSADGGTDVIRGDGKVVRVYVPGPDPVSRKELKPDQLVRGDRRIVRTSVPDDESGYEAFETRALANLSNTSRTAKGISDTSSSELKQKLMVPEGPPLAAKTTQNFKEVLRTVWDQRTREFKSAAEVHKFAEDLARQMNKGLLPPGQELYRTWTTPHNQTPPAEIRDATRTFTGQLYERLSSGADPVATAAWSEKRMSVIHPWADSVGRSSRALSAFVLARAGVGLPKYPDTKTYYSEIKKSPASWEKYYRSLL